MFIIAERVRQKIDEMPQFTYRLTYRPMSLMASTFGLPNKLTFMGVLVRYNRQLMVVSNTTKVFPFRERVKFIVPVARVSRSNTYALYALL